MKLLRVGLFALAICISSSGAFAQTGRFACNDLLRFCQNGQTYLKTYKADTPEVATQSSICVGYLTGFVDGSATFAAPWEVPPFCVPDAATAQMLGLMFVEWADKNIDELNQPAAICILHMMSEKFPCVGKKK